MASVQYREIAGRSRALTTRCSAVLGALVAAGLGAAWHMEHQGHYVTGMSNRIVWGTPHVFAVFLIVAASGALNVASIASVFGRDFYKPLARLSGLLAMTLLAGGLAVLVLDLGRPDRLIVAMTHYNFKSIFAWNIFLYTGFFAVVALYLWTMFERRMNGYSSRAGLFAFFWRLVLTTGTGSIFGFLVAREAYNSALLRAAVHRHVVLLRAGGIPAGADGRLPARSGRALGERIAAATRKLLGVFVAAVLYFVALYHLTNLYVARQHEVERFHSAGRRRLHGAVLVRADPDRQHRPARAAVQPHLGPLARAIAVASLCVIAGGLAQLYVIIIGGQAYPQLMFPDKEVDEQLLRRRGRGLRAQPAGRSRSASGGVALALALTAVALSVLPFLPRKSRRRRRPTRPQDEPPARLRRAQVLGQDHGVHRLVRGTARARRGGAAVQEGPGLHRSDLARAGGGTALLQPRPLAQRCTRKSAPRSRAACAAPRWASSRATRVCTTDSTWTAATATPRSPRCIDTPVVLVIDARGMTRGIAPLILGYQAFDRNIRIAGVILNQLGGARHEAKLRAVIEHYTDVPVLGAVAA